MIGEQLVSAVIVKGEHGFTATLRFQNSQFDKIFASNSRYTMYRAIENYLMRGEGNGADSYNGQ